MLGAEHRQQYENTRLFAKSLREDAASARYELRDYLRLLRIADLNEARIVSRGVHKRGAHAKASRSDSKYEKALERLSELTAANPSILAHLDRPFDPRACGPNDPVGADSESMPRLRQGEGANVTAIATIRELRIDALREAIADVDSSVPQQGMNPQLLADMERLRAMVRR